MRVSCVAARCGDGFVRTGVEECDDSNTANGDGCSATCLQEGCVAAAAIPCNGTVSGSLSGAMATDDFDSWECFSLSSYGGPELVYSFVPDGTGLVEVTLTGLTADADLMVMRVVSGRCAADRRCCAFPPPPARGRVLPMSASSSRRPRARRTSSSSTATTR
ncbi:MAG: DUF4215 domain-containing protein [Polyangiales bacterium]